MLLLTEATRSGVEEYEQIEVDETAGPGPQRCKFFLNLSICRNLFSYIMMQKYLCKMRSYTYYGDISFEKCCKEPRHSIVFVLSVTLQTIKFDEIQCFWKWKTPFDFLCTKYTNLKQPPVKVVPGISVFNIFL